MTALARVGDVGAPAPGQRRPQRLRRDLAPEASADRVVVLVDRVHHGDCLAAARVRRVADDRRLREGLRAALVEAGRVGVWAGASRAARVAQAPADWCGGHVVGTLYRHFPRRSDLVVAVLHREIDACADAGAALRTSHEPAVALARWLERYTAFVATKRGLATALHSGDPAFDALPGYFWERLGPVLEELLDAAAATGEIRADVSARDLLTAVSLLCHPAPDTGPDYSHRMVGLLADGLRATDRETADAPEHSA